MACCKVRLFLKSVGAWAMVTSSIPFLLKSPKSLEGGGRKPRGKVLPVTLDALRSTSKKRNLLAQRGDSVVESSDCSFRGPGLESQDSHSGCSCLSVTRCLGYMGPMQAWCIDIHAGKNILICNNLQNTY